jgi:hypothetical protein
MQLHVKVTPEGLMGVCTRCLAGRDQAMGTHVIQFTIETADGVDTCGPYCFTCLAMHNPTNPTQMVFQLGAVTPPAGPVPPSHRLRKTSRRQEKRIAEDIGGQAQKGSGACSGAKGDVRRHGDFRIEAKLTQSNQYILKASTLHKIMSECSGLERPALVLDFIERGSHRTKESWAVIPYCDFLEIVNAPSQH